VPLEVSLKFKFTIRKSAFKYITMEIPLKVTIQALKIRRKTQALPVTAKTFVQAMRWISCSPS
jgi:hypothetical protein